MGKVERHRRGRHEGEFLESYWGRSPRLIMSSSQMHIRTFPDAIKGAALWPILKFMKLTHMGPFKLKPVDILHEFDGCLKPGEMCLVLGRPGSGCVSYSLGSEADSYTLARRVDS